MGFQAGGCQANCSGDLPPDVVESFNGRTGIVFPLAGDYSSEQVIDSSTVGGVDVEASLDMLKTSVDAAQADATQALLDSATAVSTANTASATATAAQADAAQAIADAAAAQATADTKVTAAGGTLTGGTIAGSTTLTGTMTATGATIAAAAATSVTVPTASLGDDSTAAASTAYVQSELDNYVADVSSATGTLAIANGGTGQTTASAALGALLPAPSNGHALVSDGLGNASFTALAIDAGTTGTLPVGRGGTGATTATGARQALLPAASSGRPLVSDGVNDASFTTIDIVGATTGTLTTARGGTSVTSSGASGNVLRSNGTTWASAVLGVADVSGAAPSNSPTFTGTVNGAGATSFTGPTPAVGDSSTSVATTAFLTALRNVAQVEREYDEFTSGAQSGALGWVAAVNGGAATVIANSTLFAGGDGTMVLSTGTNAAGRAALSRETTASLLGFSQPWLTGTFVMEWRIQLPVLPTVTNNFTSSLALGVGSTVGADDFTSGIGVRYDFTSGQWVFVSRNGAADVGTPQNTGVAPTAATWQYIYFILNSTNARCFIGSTKALATLVATVPVADLTFAGAIGPIAKARNTAGGVGTRQLVIDLYAHEYIKTTAR